MGPKPYSERESDPFDLTPLSQDLPNFPIPLRDETPSPRTPSTSGSASPPPLQIAESRPLLPILAGEDGIPYDHTLPEFIRQVSGQPALDDVEAMSLRVFTQAASLQQITLYIPNLRELNLDGSSMTTLRDIGSELSHLHILRVSRCRLASLDGVMGLINLRELHASGNAITSAAPCSHLSHLRLLDISRNLLRDPRSLTFLSRCRNLRFLLVADNPFHNIINNADMREFVRSALPALEYIDNISVNPTEATSNNSAMEIDLPTQPLINPPVFQTIEALTSSNSSASSEGSSRVSSAGNASDSSTSRNDSHGEGRHSRYTSGRFLRGNIASARRRRVGGSGDQPATSVSHGQRRSTSSHRVSGDSASTSRQWRAAYHLYRQMHAQQWEDEREAENEASTQETNENDSNRHE